MLDKFTKDLIETANDILTENTCGNADCKYCPITVEYGLVCSAIPMRHRDRRVERLLKKFIAAQSPEDLLEALL